MAHRSVFFVFSIASVGANELCALSESCIGRTLNDTNSTLIQGYKAASSSITSFSGGSIACDATYSCNSMSFIHATSGEISCTASNACSNTTIQSNTSIGCSGAHSCANSNIISPKRIKCSGSQSCANANITAMESVYCHGMLALYKAVIDTLYSAVSVIHIYLRSHLAAYGASFICRETHECHIHCLSIDACYMFYIHCIGTCDIDKASPNYHSPITDLNIFTRMDYNNYTVYKSFDYSTIPFAPYTNLQCTMDQWTFDDQYELLNGDSVVVTADSEGPVCCRGYGSCQSVQVIEYKTQTKKDLICSARIACYKSTIQNINGNLFCHGTKSCHTTVIHYATNIYCGGYASCSRAVITGATNIICHGGTGCNTATVISGGNDVNIYAFGYRGADSLKLYCDDTDHCILHCIGLRSCQHVTFLCNGNCIVHCYDENEYCPTFNPSVAPTFIPLYNSSSTQSLHDVNRSITIATAFYTSMDNKQPPTKSKDNTLKITLILVSCVIILVAAYFVRQYYSKKKKAEKQAQSLQLSAKLKQKEDNTTDKDTHVVTHSMKSIDDMVMEEEDAVHHISESSDTDHDSLYVKGDDIQQKESGTTGEGTEEIQNEGEAVEQEGAPDNVLETPPDATQIPPLDMKAKEMKYTVEGDTKQEDESPDSNDMFVVEQDANDSEDAKKKMPPTITGKTSQSQNKQQQETQGDVYYDKYHDQIHEAK